MRPLASLLVALILSLDCGGYSSPPAAAPRAQAAETMTATVRQVNVRDSTVSTVYGVALALKVVDVTVSPECTVSTTSGTGRLADLRRGQVIRVRYRMYDNKMVATVIEVLRNPGGER